MPCKHVVVGGTNMLINLAPPTLKMRTGDGQEFRFEFHEYLGPGMIGKRGEPIQSMPGKRSPFWDALHFWIKQGKQVDENGYCIYKSEMQLVQIWKWIGNGSVLILQ